MLHLKDKSVIVEGLQPEMHRALGLADQAFADERMDCVISAALDGDHNPGSKHAKGFAVDLSNQWLDTGQHERILEKLKRLERYGFDVVDEKADATAKTTAPHFHIEYDPKPGETFWKGPS